MKRLNRKGSAVMCHLDRPDGAESSSDDDCSDNGGPVTYEGGAAKLPGWLTASAPAAGGEGSGPRRRRNSYSSPVKAASAAAEDGELPLRARSASVTSGLTADLKRSDALKTKVMMAMEASRLEKLGLGTNVRGGAMF